VRILIWLARLLAAHAKDNDEKLNFGTWVDFVLSTGQIFIVLGLPVFTAAHLYLESPPLGQSLGGRGLSAVITAMALGTIAVPVAMYRRRLTSMAQSQMASMTKRESERILRSVFYVSIVFVLIFVGFVWLFYFL